MPESIAARASRPASLDLRGGHVKIVPPFSERLRPPPRRHRWNGQVNVHRYEEQIAGRTYLIEVSPVSQTRWRAQIARRPGMPTSLMPFYGPTPEEAAGELRQWLRLIYQGSGIQ